MPLTSPDGNDIDYKSQVAFATSSGKTIVVSTDVDYDYNFTIGRIDVLAWNSAGVLVIQQGNP